MSPRTRARRRPRRAVSSIVLDEREASLLELVDHVLNKGVMVTGDLVLGIAGVDLVYVRLSALLCAADRLLPRHALMRRTRARA